MRKRTISNGNSNIEPIDNWLENNGLHRKQVPRDASCLFRASAEQLCYAQSHHENLRNLTLDYMLLYKSYFQAHLEEPLEKYVRRMRSPFEWGTRLELLALGFIFKTDFVVFNDDCLLGAPPNFNFNQKLLYRSSTNHYDIVYRKEKVLVAGYCQALVYDILYSKVFKMDNVYDVVDKMLHEASDFRHDSVNSEGQELEILRIVEEVTCKTSEINLDTSIEISTPEKGLTPPFPYRVAKVLDPNIYRNADYDAWIALKREARFGPYDPNGLQIGAKVLIKTNKLTKTIKNESQSEDTIHGHIQFMTENQGPVEVFAEELGRRITVPYNCLEKYACPPNTPKYCYRDTCFPIDSPPTYRMLSSITKKPKLPIPENYNSPARGGKVKKKGMNAAAYSLPDPIYPQNTNRQKEESEKEREMPVCHEYSRISSGSSLLNSSENSDSVEARSLNEASNEAIHISGSPESFVYNSGEHNLLVMETPVQPQYYPCYDQCCIANQYMAYSPYGDVCGYCYVPYSLPYYFVYPENPQYIPGDAYNYSSDFQ